MDRSSTCPYTSPCNMLGAGKAVLNQGLMMTFTKKLLISALALASTSVSAKKPDTPVSYQAPYTAKAPSVDGKLNDAAWDKAIWRAIPYLIAGTPPRDKFDLSARYKVVWTHRHLYVLAEISDDIHIDSHPNPLDNYWDDDALEIFIDEDNSGGRHLFNYNAFAYHIALDNQSVDMGPFLSEADEDADNTNIRTYPHHVQAQWQRSETEPYKIYWEAKIAIFPDTYQDEYAPHQSPVKPVELTLGKKIGFMMSYCDSDSPNGRDHFIGDIDIPPVSGDKNRGYIDADVFGILELKE